MITEGMLQQAAEKAALAINESLPAPEECHHDFSSEFEKRVLWIFGFSNTQQIQSIFTERRPSPYNNQGTLDLHRAGHDVYKCKKVPQPPNKGNIWHPD